MKFGGTVKKFEKRVKFAMKKIKRLPNGFPVTYQSSPGEESYRRKWAKERGISFAHSSGREDNRGLL